MNPQEYIRTIAIHYPDSDSIHRVLEYASVDIINVDIEGKPLNTWFMALKEVVNQNRLPDFINTISAEYPALKINIDEQNGLKKFLAKKVIKPGERNDNIKKYSSLFLKFGVPLILISGYIIFSSIGKEKPSHPSSVVVVRSDSSSSNAVKFVSLQYKDEPFVFPANKNILQLKQFLLGTKEGLRNFDAGRSQLSFKGIELSDEIVLSKFHWENNRKVDLAITMDSTKSVPHLDVFIQNIRLDDPMIFIEDQAGYVTEIHNDRTRLWIPKYLGNHNLEIYFKDSLAVLLLHIESSTSSISIPAEEFNKSTKLIRRVIVQ